MLVRIDGTELGSVHQNEAQTARETRKKPHFPVEIGSRSKKFSRASAGFTGFTEAPVRTRPTFSQPRWKGSIPPKTAKWNKRPKIDEFSLCPLSAAEMGEGGAWAHGRWKEEEAGMGGGRRRNVSA